MLTGYYGNYHDGWAALCVSILKNVSPEKAFELLETPTGKRSWTSEDIAEIDALREEGLLWREIAQMFGTSKYTINRIWRYYKNKQRAERERT